MHSIKACDSLYGQLNIKSLRHETKMKRKVWAQKWAVGFRIAAWTGPEGWRMIGTSGNRTWRFSINRTEKTPIPPDSLD
jgi:hypothetical protein